MIKIKLKKGSKSKISGIEMKTSASGSEWLRDFEGLNHIDLAKKLTEQKLQFCSVIILKDRLDNDLWNNPKYSKTENFIGISKLHEEARKRLINKYYDDSELEDILSKQSFPNKQFNFKDDVYKPSFISKLKDEIYKSQELAMIPEIYDQYKESAKYTYDEKSDSEIELSEVEYELAIKSLNQELFLPQVYTQFNRVYSMPKPFHFWDDRNNFQQYFLMSNESEVNFIQSGPASSHQREMHGLWGHTFASLARNQKIKTFVFKYNSKNELHLVNEFSDFKAVQSDLTGNYRMDWSKTRNLFDGRLLQIEFDAETSTQSLIEYESSPSDMGASL